MAQADLEDFADATAGVELPDAYEWRDQPTDLTNGLRVVMPEGPINPDGGDYLDVGEICFVVGGEDEYLANYRDRELDVSPYYSRFDDEWETYVGAVTAKRNSTARGIGASRLEAAFRVADGPGRMGDVQVIGCGGDPFIVRGERGTVAVSPEFLRLDIDPSNVETWTIDGVDVPEADPEVRAGIEEFFAVIEEYEGISVTGYADIRRGKHYFETEDGQGVKAGGHHFKTLLKATTDVEAILGEYEYETPWEETYVGTVTEEDIVYALGEELWGDTVVGYTVNWTDPRRNSRASLSGRIGLTLNYVRLNIRRSPQWDVRVERKSETVAEFEPENQEYDPLAV